jgi:hypothetical protein
MVGKSVFIGIAELGVESGFTDYSRKDRDQFGDTYLLPGNYTEPLDVDLYIPTPNGDQLVAKVKNILIGLRATPCVFDANNHAEDGADGTERETLATLGFIQKFRTVVRFSNYTHCSLTIQGLT